jgi:ABC-type branched-subunit amino acid transport system substrate-binding protein
MDTRWKYRARGRRLGLLPALAAIAIVGALATSGTAVAASQGNVTFGVLMPFSGASAPDGPQTLDGCLAASYAMNKAGGVLGHKAVCKEYDTRSDPVDTVPAARQMLATASNLVAVYGPDSGVAPAVSPLLEKAKMTMCSVAGDPYYDHQTSPYFYRFQPSDDLAAEALVVDAKARGFHKVAFVFTTDGSAQTNDPPMTRAARLDGLDVVVNQQILADQSSYRSEVAALVAAHPQAILTETDPQSTGTYFSELAQADGLVPIIVTGESSYPAYQKAMEQAIGENDMKSLVTGIWATSNSSGPGWKAFTSFLKSAPGTTPKEYLNTLWTESEYDCGTLMALGMVKANSLSPSVYNKYVPSFLQPGAGKTLVHTFAEGAAALKAGKSIYYVGALGPVSLNKYHNVDTPFAIEHWNGSTFIAKGFVPPKKIAAIALH